MAKKYLSKIKDLTTLQYNITQNNATEPAFANEYWDNEKDGIYVDIVSGEPLFSSLDKFDSGCGWPSFSKTLENSEIILKEDLSHGLKRTEVATRVSHLGHLFEDGPKNMGGLRYCINSASIKFIAKDQLLESGYGDFMILFSNPNLIEHAYLAGGCFWGMEYYLSKLKGIIKTSVGYAGGEMDNPTYEEVSKDITGHAETVAVTFNPSEISYRQILKLFFKIHDPTTLNRQGNDKGTQYRSIIFYTDEIQKYIAKNIIEQANQSGVFFKPVVTQLVELQKFYEAEEYHQKYLEQNSSGYNCHFIRNDWNF